MLKLLYLSRPLERRVIGLFFPSKYKIEYKDMWAICGHGRVDYDTFLLEIYYYLIIQYYSTVIRTAWFVQLLKGLELGSRCMCTLY